MNEFYPLGTVVRLSGDEDFLMIVGRAVDDGEATYDYAGVPFPIGVQGSDYYFFDGADIEEVTFIGFQDQRELSFIKGLTEFIEKVGSAAEDAE